MSATNPTARAGLSLYTIASEYVALDAKLRDMGLDEATVADTLEGEGVKGDLIDKLHAVVAVALSMETEAQVIEQQIIERAKARIKKLTDRAYKLREYALKHMIDSSIPEVSTYDLRFRMRDLPPACTVVDQSLVPPQYLKRTVIPQSEVITVDKAAVNKHWLQTDEDVPGTTVKRGKRLEIL